MGLFSRKPKEPTVEEKNKATYFKYFDKEKYCIPTEDIETYIAGIHITGRVDNCLKCKKGGELMLIREPENKYDENAILIMSFRGDQLGYIPAHIAENLAPKLDDDIYIKVIFISCEFGFSRFESKIILNEHQPKKE